MTSFGIDLVKDRKSVLNMISHIYSLENKTQPEANIPNELQKLKKVLPFYAKHFFTDNIGAALELLMKSKFTTDEIAGRVGSSMYYFRESKLRKAFQSREFLYFCACYIPKAARHYFEVNDFKPTLEVYEAIIRIIRRNRQKAKFSDESWKVLDEASSEIVTLEMRHKKDLAKICASKFEDELFLNHAYLAEQRQFLLEMAIYISDSFFESVPGSIDTTFAKVPTKSSTHFTPAVEKATTVILQNREDVFERVKKEGVLEFDQWLERIAMSFHARDFLECSSCLFYDHVSKYFKENKPQLPTVAYQALLYILKEACEAGMFSDSTWVILETAAKQIIAEYDLNATESYDEALARSERRRLDGNFHFDSDCEESVEYSRSGSQVTLVENVESDEVKSGCCICC